MARVLKWMWIFFSISQPINCARFACNRRARYPNKGALSVRTKFVFSASQLFTYLSISRTGEREKSRIHTDTQRVFSLIMHSVWLLLLLMHSFLSKHLKCLCMRSHFSLEVLFRPLNDEFKTIIASSHRRRFFLNNWFIWCVCVCVFFSVSSTL